MWSGVKTGLVCVILLGVGQGIRAAPDPAEEPGWVSLFNGRDFTGWVNVNCAPETWSVSDGMIHCTGLPTGALRTVRHYENFVLELEWRHLRSRGNAGVFLWAGPIAAKGVPFLRAVEVQVLENAYGQTEHYTTHGDVFPIHGSTMSPHGRNRGMRSFPSEHRSRSAPEWNHYRIVATNGVIRLSVNGKEVSGGSDCNYRKGYLALESEGSPVQFRNLRILELPSGAASPETTAPVDPGWLPLYSGLDLRGWRADGEAGSERWAASDWRLVARDQRGRGASTLWATEGQADADWILDFKVPEKADLDQPCGAVYLSGVPGPVVSIGTGPGQWVVGRGWVRPGQWHRLQLRRDASGVRVSLDEQLVGMTPVLGVGGGRRKLGLGEWGRGMEYANIYVRPR